MQEQKNIQDFSDWVNKISRNKTYLNKLKEEAGEQDFALFREYIDEQIIKQMQSVNAIYLSNPAWKYGKDFTIEELENLKKVRALLEP